MSAKRLTTPSPRPPPPSAEVRYSHSRSRSSASFPQRARTPPPAAARARGLRPPAGARRDVREGVGREARRKARERDPATEQDPAEAEQPATRHHPRQPGVAELDRAGQERPDRSEEGDGLHADPELVDDREG